jgi:hypothetical protein
MIALLLGCASLLVLMGALGQFSQARVQSVKQMGIWGAAIGGLLLAALLFLTGRSALAISALAMLGPLMWGWVKQAIPRDTQQRPTARRGGMNRAEALEVLGLPESASKSDIQAAYVRLMRTAHPDQGGSDWLAARINQARDTLLG